MQNFNPVAGEVVDVEGENPSDPVHVHGNDEPRVMHLCAEHTALNDQALSFRVGGGPAEYCAPTSIASWIGRGATKVVRSPSQPVASTVM